MNSAFAAKFIEVKGLKLAFLPLPTRCLCRVLPAGAEQPGVAFFEREKGDSCLQAARDKADFVVVSMHAGTEYEPAPDLAQTRLARLAVDAGADLVLGITPCGAEDREIQR